VQWLASGFQVLFWDTHPSRSSIGWVMELMSQTKVSGSSVKPQTFALLDGLFADQIDIAEHSFRSVVAE